MKRSALPLLSHLTTSPRNSFRNARAGPWLCGTVTTRRPLSNSTLTAAAKARTVDSAVTPELAHYRNRSVRHLHRPGEASPIQFKSC